MADRSGYIGRNPGDSSVIVARQVFSPTGVQTDFTFASGYVVGYLDAYLNGSRLIEGQDYSATDTSTVGLTSFAQSGDVLELVAYKAFNVATIDTAPGNLTVGTNLTVGGYISAGGSITGSVFYGDGSNLTGINSVSFATTAFNLEGTPNITVGTIDATSLNASGIATASSFSGTNLNLSGIATASSFSGTNLNLSGIATASSFSGSGSGLTGVSTNFVSAIGIQSAGTAIGAGITQLNFIGAGNTFAVDGTTVNISIAGGGGGGITSLDITSSLFI